MYNLRYHVASLVAVFLALAVGLLLGTVVAERGVITDQSSALVAGLQERFDEISAANDELRIGLERDREFAEDAATALVDGRLAGRRVVVLVGAGRVDGVGDVERAIADAGGTAEEWLSGSDRALTDLLGSAGLLDMPGSFEETAPASGLVIMAPADEGVDAFALALARAVQDAGGTAVGAESADTGTGVAAACAAAGLPAVGHMSVAQGRLSLVWALAGQTDGYFGPAQGADGYYPPLAFQD